MDAAPYVARLRNNVTFGGADSAETPNGEYFSLFFPDGSGGERFDFFAAGGNYVREVYGTNGEYEFLYKATYTDGTTRAGDIMQKWYMALAAANGIVPQASSPLPKELEPVDPPAESPVWSAGSPDK